MRTIYKYDVLITPQPWGCSLPCGALFLYADVQDGIPHMWWELDTNEELVEYVFFTVGIGGEIPSDPEGRWYAQHLATFQLPPFVWHLYTHYEALLDSPE